MTKLYVLFFVTLIIFIITTEFISFRYINREDMRTLKIDFNIFGITLIKDKHTDKGKEKRKRRLPPPSNRIILSLIKSIIAKSNIEINAINLNFSYETPSEYAYKRTLYSSLFCIILSYLHNYSKSVQYNNTVTVNEDFNGKKLLDVKFSLNLIFLLYSFAVFMTRYIKEQINRKWQRAE